MEVVLIIIYFILICWGFKAIRLDKKVDLSFQTLVILFGIKVLCGCLNLYFHNSEYLTNDAHTYFTSAVTMLNDFPNQPAYYLKDWFFNWGDIFSHLNFLDSANATYWSDIGRLIHQRFMVLSTVLSFRHEYVNVVFYNLFFFIGLLGLYKTFLHFKPKQKNIFIALIFILPSVAFWCSGIHKDGFILSAFGMVSWYTIKVFQSRNWKNVLLLIFLLFLLLALRYFYFLIFLPLFIVHLVVRNKSKPYLYYTALVGVGVMFFLFSNQLSPKLDFMKMVVNRQQEFLRGKGYSDLKTPVLENNAVSFIKNIPTALEHIFIEPIPSWRASNKYGVTAFDSGVVLILLLVAFIKIKRKYLSNSFTWVVLFYSLLCLLFIGYTIPNLGALVRYESPFICLLLLALFSFGNAILFEKTKL